MGAGGQGWQCLAGVRRTSKRRRGAHSLASCSPWALVTCRMDVMSHLRFRLARSEKRHAPHTHTRLRPAAAQRRPQPAACRAMRLNVRAHLLPMRILFTVCGALASMLRTQLRILLHVLVLVTSCAGWLAGLGCSTRVDITRAPADSNGPAHVNEEDAHGAAVVSLRDRAEALLPCSGRAWVSHATHSLGPALGRQGGTLRARGGGPAATHLAGGVPNLQLDLLAIEVDSLRARGWRRCAAGSGQRPGSAARGGRSSTLILKSMPMVASTLSLKSSSAYRTSSDVLPTVVSPIIMSCHRQPGAVSCIA